MIDTSVIINAVKMDDICAMYGFQKNSAGFICCPFHNERTPSLRIYEGTKGWHCFGCGKGGDVISFVQMYFNLKFFDAVCKLNDDFGLRLDLDRKDDADSRREAVRAKLADERRKSAEEYAAREHESALNEYYKLYRMMRTLWNNRRRDAPLSQRLVVIRDEMDFCDCADGCENIDTLSTEEIRERTAGIAQRILAASEEVPEVDADTG